MLILELNFLPLMSICCQICPDNLEATTITLFTGLINLSNNLSNYIGSLVIWLTNIN